MEPAPPGSHGEERRTNLRLRAIIDELQAGVRENRGAIEILTGRVTTIANEVDSLKQSRS